MTKTLPHITVGIMQREKIEFSLHSDYSLEGTLSIFTGVCTATVNKGLVQLHSDKELLSAQEILLEPIVFTEAEFELKEVTIGVNFHWEQKENQKFQGALKLIAEENQVRIINILPVENYLMSVISSEMSAQCSLELLKAHAIISRSWLIAQIEKQDQLVKAEDKYNSFYHTHEEYIRWYDREDHVNFHVCADDHCQRYQGTTRILNPDVIKAVRETLGIILSYQGKVCDARFSKCCGGVTERFENCWEPVSHPYLTSLMDDPSASIQDLSNEENAKNWIESTPDVFCNTHDAKVLQQVLNDYDQKANDFFRWTKEYSQEQLSELIKQRSGFDFGEILDLIPVERGSSGRLIKLKILGTKKTIIVGKELEIRRWLSQSHLYSSAFWIEKQNIMDHIPQKFILHGAGWGHGVGLCQIGAAMMSQQGYLYDDILLHYYKNVVLEKRY